MLSTIDRFKESDTNNEGLFECIALDIQEKGYSINPNALPLYLGDELLQHVNKLSNDKFEEARIGRDELLMQNNFVRRNEICWITGESSAGREWLDWSHKLQVYLNRRLLLGLFSFESHFSYYAVGDFYKRHMDAHIGNSNRILSVVVYLNPDWLPENAGELVLYTSPEDQVGIKVTPSFGTIVTFLSEEFPHEVLPTQRGRHSIAGWFRVNTSILGKIDPPR